MPDVLMIGGVGGLVSFLGVVFYLLRSDDLRRRSRNRLNVDPRRAARAARATTAGANALPLITRYRQVPWVAAAVLGVAGWLFGLPLIFAVAVAVIVALLLVQAEMWWAERRTAQVEAQLAEAIDLMVGALQAGGSATVAMDRAGQESAEPLKTFFGDAMARIQYGDDPPAVMARLERRVPTEAFRLFTTTMSVHWEVGGSLAPTLAIVGRVVRDRIDVARRIRSLTAQARVSTVMLLLTTYFIAFLMWRQDPDRVRRFVASPIGSIAVAGSMVMEAIGILWQALASRVRY